MSPAYNDYVQHRRGGVPQSSRTLDGAKRVRTMCNTADEVSLLAVPLCKEPSVKGLCATPPRRRPLWLFPSASSQAYEDYVQHQRRGVPHGRRTLQDPKRIWTMCNTADAPASFGKVRARPHMPSGPCGFRSTTDRSSDTRVPDNRNRQIHVDLNYKLEDSIPYLNVACRW